VKRRDGPHNRFGMGHRGGHPLQAMQEAVGGLLGAFSKGQANNSGLGANLCGYYLLKRVMDGNAIERKWEKELHLRNTESVARATERDPIRRSISGTAISVISIEWRNHSIPLANIALSFPTLVVQKKGQKMPLLLEKNSHSGFIKPVGYDSWVSSPFGFRWGRHHKGVDLAAPHGAAVIASDKGLVTFAGWDDHYGNFVEVTHGDGWRTLYAHANEVYAVPGQRVQRGECIATVGATGLHCTGAHLHFEVQRPSVLPSGATVWTPVDPKDYVRLG